jgi:putative FmdB family regulatory protein
MPTYEYRCEACGHQFDEFQSFKDEPLSLCPKCHQESLRRLFGTGAAILFKGSGFYETDYRSDSYKQAAKADAEAGKGTAGKAQSNGKSESNGAAASTTKSETKSETGTT